MTTKPRSPQVPISNRTARILRAHVGAELTGPCPKCGGSDRFASWVRSRNIAWAKAQQKAGAAA